MKKNSNIRLGPGAPSLILIFVVLSMSVLAMLSLMSAKNDLRLSQRSVEAAETVYRLREQAEIRRGAAARYFAEGGEEAVEAALTADPLLSIVEREADQLIWAEEDGTRTLTCAVTLEAGMAWSTQRLTTNIGEDTAQDRETAAKLALADAILDRQKALDDMLERCAADAEGWEDYLARAAAAMLEEPAAEGVRLEDGHFKWIETDGQYSYACDVVIHALDAEHRSDFAGIPALLEEEEEIP